jgi:hypothetical protein
MTYRGSTDEILENIACSNKEKSRPNLKKFDSDLVSIRAVTSMKLGSAFRGGKHMCNQNQQVSYPDRRWNIDTKDKEAKGRPRIRLKNQ